MKTNASSPRAILGLCPCLVVLRLLDLRLLVLWLLVLWLVVPGGRVLAQPAPTAAGGIVDAPPASLPFKQMPMWDEMEQAQDDSDPMLQEAIDLSRRQGRASISMLQRRLRIGYTRAARIIETMEERGIVGPPEPGSGARQILDYGPAAPPVDDN